MQTSQAWGFLIRSSTSANTSTTVCLPDNIISVSLQYALHKACLNASATINIASAVSSTMTQLANGSTTHTRNHMLQRFHHSVTASIGSNTTEGIAMCQVALVVAQVVMATMNTSVALVCMVTNKVQQLVNSSTAT